MSRITIHSSYGVWRIFLSGMLFILILISQSCTSRSGTKPTDVEGPAATLTLTGQLIPTPLPLPPALVESNPPQNVEIPLQGPITLYFNQPMERSSVEAALKIQFQQEVRFDWIDESSVVVYLSEPLPPETQLAFSLGENVRSAGGKPLSKMINLVYQTAGYLRLAQNLPEKDTQDVDPSGAVMAAFNRPVVPLGSDRATLPAGFSLSPMADGRGEWINTSTYIFYPDPGLEGGKHYTVTINPELKSTDGGPLQDAKPWSFDTAQPALVKILPETEKPWGLEPDIELTFSQSMDRESVESNFSFSGLDGIPLPGEKTWNEDDTVMTFRPMSLLRRDIEYQIQITNQAQARGGTPFEEAIKAIVKTVPELTVLHSEPDQGQEQYPDNDVVLYLSSPVHEMNILDLISIKPDVPDLKYYWDENMRALRLTGPFSPSTDYTLRISANLTDVWGGTLGEDYILPFRTRPLNPNIYIPGYSQAIFVPPAESQLLIQAVNLNQIPLSIANLSLDEFLTLLGPIGYEKQAGFKGSSPRSWTQPIQLEPDRIQPVELYLTPNQSVLAPGLYLLRFEFPQSAQQSASDLSVGPYFIVASNLQVLFKISTSDALVWAVDLRNGNALANSPVTIFAQDGSILSSGQTDNQGIFRTAFPDRENPYDSAYAVVGQPGEENFGIAISNWSAGIEPYEYGVIYMPEKRGIHSYFYTDRPIYRPGQTVYFRAISRLVSNGRYSSPGTDMLSVDILGEMGQLLATYDLPVSPYGTSHGEFSLPEGTKPGYYLIQSKDFPESNVSFQVANYRKPEINLNVSLDPDQVIAGQSLIAHIDARYFFDTPVGNLPMNWILYAENSPMSLTDYQVGKENDQWLQAFRVPDYQGPLGKKISEGKGQTRPDGTLILDFPTNQLDVRQKYTLEVSARDESQLPVSARGDALVHPDEFYIGIKIETSVGRAGEEFDVEIQSVDWDGTPEGGHELRAEIQKVVWERKNPPASDLYGQPEFIPSYTPISKSTMITDEAGKSRLTFTPAAPGNYIVDVYNAKKPAGKGARSQQYLWIGGPGEVVWPDLPNSRLRLTSDKTSYLPGETTQIFIPNPYGDTVQALITVERGQIISHQSLQVPAEGYNFTLQVNSEHAPNIYLSATLLGRDKQGQLDFRQGFLNLTIDPVEQTLNVKLVSQPKRAGPGDAITFDIQATDSTGQPIQGEFSLSVVDLAALALADPNSQDIVNAFYGVQPNGVSTSLSLAAYNPRVLNLPLGMGGGGGEAELSVIREEFPDTAYWNAEIITGPDGKANVELKLPDSLTSWQVESRGLTQDTLVGQAEDQIVTTKELLLRSVTPRFLVVGDRALVAAIVQNNTSNPLLVDVNLQASGISLDNPAKQMQQVQVPAEGRARVEWWGQVQDAESADLVFSANAEDPQSGIIYKDFTRPAMGDIPVLNYTIAQSFQTSGVMDEAGEVAELVSLPRSYDAKGGELVVELSPSLAAAMLRAMDTLEASSRDNSEQVLSSFLPNLEFYHTLQAAGIDNAALKTRLDRTLNQGLQILQSRQNLDGGWAWSEGVTQSDPYMTAYILLGLARAQKGGISINSDLVRNAVAYLQSVSTQPVNVETQENQSVANEIPSTSVLNTHWPVETWLLDRMAMLQYALVEVNTADADILRRLYADKGKLSPWAQAILALALEKQAPSSEEARTLLSDLQSQAVRSASGAYWEFKKGEEGLVAAQQNMLTPLSNTAVVLFALAQRDPGSPTVTSVLRYIMSSRDANGAWTNSYSTAWALMALNEVIKGTGELGGSYSFGATFNLTPIADGEASGSEQTTPVISTIPIQRLYAQTPNSLVIQRGSGQGRLYYLANLNTSLPADKANPLSQGLNIERAYLSNDTACENGSCDPITSGSAGQKVKIRLSLTLPHDAYYLAVQDYIPAGAEILDTSLKTTEIGEGDASETQMTYDPRQPLKDGWGAWLFNQPQIYDERILWTVDYLPAGTYQLTYTLVLLQPGEYRSMPARAWQFYFPDVQANSTGSVFKINP